jgi:hypothetical protein
MINSLNANQKTFVNEIRNNQKKYLLNRLKTTAPGLAQLRDKPLTRGNNNRTKRAATRGVTTPVSAPKRVNTTPVSAPKRVNTTPVSTPNRVNNTPVSAPNGNGTNVNNTTKRIKNLNAYLNNLQRQLGNKGNLNKSVYLSKLRQTNSNTMLANMKVRANANAQRISRMSNRPRTGSN